MQRLYKIQCGKDESDSYEKAALERAAVRGISCFEDLISDAMYERYINGRTWEEIADILCIADSCTIRKKCERALNSATNNLSNE